MSKLSNILLIFIALITLSLAQLPVLAQKTFDSKTFNVEIPDILTVESVGISPRTQTHGLPSTALTSFNMIVSESTDGQSWELTTGDPVGVSVSYNTSGSIIAIFASMTRIPDGHQIPETDIKIYPSKVIFDTGTWGGDQYRIFHFNPIIRVSKNTPPGHYVSVIRFTVLAE